MFMYHLFAHADEPCGGHSSGMLSTRGKRRLSAALCVCITILLCLSAFADAPITAYHGPDDPWADIRSVFPAPSEGAVQTSAHAHVLMEADSGAVLDRKNADEHLPMASTTKIMTALVALESMPTDTVVTVPREAVGVEGSSVYLVEGEVLTLRELLLALMLESANDAAVAVAITVGGSVDSFADMMNRKAAALGLTDTHFTNPHGLDDPDHYTTARELALITRAALALPAFRELVSTHKATIPMHTNEVCGC